MTDNPKIVITAGDLAGVSGTIILKALSDEQVKEISPVIYGDKYLFQNLQKKLVANGKIKYQELFIHDSLNAKIETEQLGLPIAKTGNAAGFYFEEAVNDAMNNKIDAIVTAPLDKDNLQRGGFNFTGHTTMIETLTNSDNAVMMLYGKYLKVALLTIHKPIREVADYITKEKIIQVTRIINDELKNKFKIQNPKIGILGLNPHAGENGKLGKEEITEFLPAIKELREEGIDIEGPFPADTYFYKTYKNYDVTIAAYHDQGLIPLKMLHFDDGVNITLGTPVIRTSVDHGTAYDIANNFDKASENSLVSAIKEAYRIAKLK